MVSLGGLLAAVQAFTKPGIHPALGVKAAAATVAITTIALQRLALLTPAAEAAGDRLYRVVETAAQAL